MAKKKVNDDDVKYYKKGQGGKARTVKVKGHTAHYGKNRHDVQVHKYMHAFEGCEKKEIIDPLEKAKREKRQKLFPYG